MNALPPDILERVRTVAQQLGPLRARVVLLGGCSVGVLISDPAAPAVRSTRDVDLLIDVHSYAEYVATLGDQLRTLGFVESAEPDAPICRWHLGAIPVDFMPIAEEALGFASHWAADAYATATPHDIGGGLFVRVVSAPYLLALKAEAYRSRGGGDVLASPDLEDFVALIDGRSGVLAEVGAAKDDVRASISAFIREQLADVAFLDALPGFLTGDAGSQRRLPELKARLQALAELR